ncbi:MAG: hypothetical protein WCG34_07940, partial [Leptolinea sp.]
MKTNKILTRFDWLLLTALVLGGLSLAAVSVSKPVHPAEDAAMLMRYAQHVSQGHGIVWNIGQAPVDGATDFLFMMALAGLYSLGAGLESTVIWMGAVSHLLTVLLVYFGIRRFFNGGILVALLSAVFLLFGPGLRYAEASFGTPFFALFCTLSWLGAQFVIEKPKKTWWAVIFALASLLMGLTRPEGVLISGFMLLAILFRLGWKQSRRVVMIFAGVLLLMGGGYFLWRWLYFGYPLPNPYYKKGGGQFYLDSLMESWKGVLELSFPFWLVFAWGVLCLFWGGFNRFALEANWFRSLKKSFLQVFEPQSRNLLISTLRVLGYLLLAGFVLGLFRQSSNLHVYLVFGRYSAQYAGLLAAMLVTGAIALTSSKWMPELNARNFEIDMVDQQQNDPKTVRFISDNAFIGIPITGFILMWVLLSN